MEIRKLEYVFQLKTVIEFGDFSAPQGLSGPEGAIMNHPEL